MKTEVVTVVLNCLIALTLLRVCKSGIFKVDNFLCHVRIVETFRTSRIIQSPQFASALTGCSIKTGILLSYIIGTGRSPCHLVAVGLLSLNFDSNFANRIFKKIQQITVSS
jgi:hypothetical protein